MPLDSRSSSNSPWIASPLLDVFFMFGGVIFALIIFWIHRSGFFSFADLILLERVLFLTLAAGHTFAPFFLLVLSSQERQRAQAADPRIYPKLFAIFAITFGLLSLSAILFSLYGPQPTAVSFRDLRWPLTLIGLLWFSWNQWHFGMQHYGVLQIYRSKTGSSTLRSRRFDFWLTILIAGIGPIFFCLHSGYSVRFITTYIGPIEFMKPYIDFIAMGILAIGALTILKSFLDPRDSAPIRMAYTALVVQLLLIWYFPLAFIAIAYFTTHWLQEIFLVTRIYAKEKAEQNRRDTKSLDFYLVMSGAIVTLVIFSAVYFGFFRYPADYPRIFISGGIGKLDAMTSQIFWTLVPGYSVFIFFATAHFYLDRVIHKGRQW